MTSETPNLHVSKNLNISKTKKNIEKLKTPLRLVWKCCSDAFQIGSTIFRRRATYAIMNFVCNNEKRFVKFRLVYNFDIFDIFQYRSSLHTTTLWLSQRPVHPSFRRAFLKLHRNWTRKNILKEINTTLVFCLYFIRIDITSCESQNCENT